MENNTWRPLRAFSLNGTINSDAMIWQRKRDYIELLGIQMRNGGYVPNLDIPVGFSLEYDIKKDSYKFQLVVYGIYVGERESEWIYGIDKEGPIPIPQSRSKESYLEAE